MEGREPHLLDTDLSTAGVPHERFASLRRSEPVCWQEAPAGEPVRLRSAELHWKRMPVRLSERRA